MIEARTPDGATHQFPDGTPDDVIDKAVRSYVAANKQPEPAPGLLAAGARGLGLGTRAVIEGAAALPGMALDAVTWPGRAIQRAVGIPTTAPSDLVAGGLDATGLPQPQTGGEQLSSAAIRGGASAMSTLGLGAAVGAPAAVMAAPVSQVVGGVTGGASADATRQAGGGPLLQTIAGMAGGMGGTAASQGSGAVTSALRGEYGGASAADATLGRLAKTKYGIGVEAPDLTRNQFVRNAYDQTAKLPFSGAQKALDHKITQWQSGIIDEMGDAAGSSFGSDVMSRTASRIGGEFRTVAAETNIGREQTAGISARLDAIEQQANQVLGDNELKPLVAQIKEIRGLIAKSNGEISGNSYLGLIAEKAPLSVKEGAADPNVAHVAGQIRDALDDGFMAAASPENQARLAQARYQWRVMKTVEPLAAKSRDGTITPDAFMQQVVNASRRLDSSIGGMAYTGGGNLGELARIGKLFRAPPQTGSADRALVNFAAIGTGIGGVVANPLIALSVPATLTANRLGGAYLRSGGLADRVIASSLGPRVPTNPLIPEVAAAIAAEASRQNRLAPD